jgi:hypothetical protein
LLNPSAENPDLPAAQRARKTGPIIRIECASRNLLIGPVHKRFSAEKEEGFRTRNLVKSRNPNAFRIKKRTVGIHGYGFATPMQKIQNPCRIPLCPNVFDSRAAKIHHADQTRPQGVMRI